MNALANLNGEIMPLAEAKVPALDRGFLFGDAVYEVLRVYQSKPFLMREHFDRFKQSLAAVRIAGVDLARLQRRLLDTIAAGPFEEAIAYLQITRGVAPRQHAFPAGITPLEFLYVQEFRDPHAEARRQGAAVLTQPDLRWERCDIKSTNLLGNILAFQTAKEAGCVEALLTLADGTLTEGTHTSFFGVLDGVVLTTPRGNAILPGITRGLVLRLAERAGIATREQSLKKADLPLVTELFLTGTTSEVLPVVRVDDHAIGDGKPGRVTRRLQEEYQATVRELVAG